MQINWNINNKQTKSGITKYFLKKDPWNKSQIRRVQSAKWLYLISLMDVDRRDYDAGSEDEADDCEENCRPPWPGRTTASAATRTSWATRHSRQSGNKIFISSVRQCYILCHNREHFICLFTQTAQCEKLSSAEIRTHKLPIATRIGSPPIFRLLSNDKTGWKSIWPTQREYLRWPNMRWDDQLIIKTLELTWAETWDFVKKVFLYFLVKACALWSCGILDTLGLASMPVLTTI